jgi:hypothetical protein
MTTWTGPESMSRPRAITVVAWLFIVVGAAGLLNDLWPLVTSHASEQLARLKSDGFADLAPAWGLRLLAIVGGVALLRGQNWARWMLAVWMLAHVGISMFHSVAETVSHVVIFAPAFYILFRSSASTFFGGGNAAHA